jgi:hypothetical protein
VRIGGTVDRLFCSARIAGDIVMDARSGIGTHIQQYRLLGAIFIAAAGIVFAIFVIHPWRPAKQQTEPPDEIKAMLVDQQTVAELEALHDAMVGPEEQGESEPGRGDPEVQYQISKELIRGGVDRASADEIATLAASRLALYAQPSYEAYAEQFRSLTGVDLADLVREGTEPTPEQWLQQASIFAEASYAMDHVTIRQSVVGKNTPWLMLGGRLQTVTDSGGRYSGTTEEPEEAWDVVVPMRLEKWRGNDGPIDLQLFQSFRRRPSDGQWVPYRVGLYDPGRKSSYLPSPWL